MPRPPLLFTASLRNSRRAAFPVLAWIGFLLSALILDAQTSFYWDANGVSAGTGGAGTWTQSNSQWRSGSDTGTLGVWSDSNYAMFGGTAGTVSLASNISARRITFASNNYTLAHSSNNTLTLVNDGFIDTGSFNATITGPIAGTVGLTKLGSGLLTLSGANTYSGVTYVNTGTLAFGSNTAAGSSVITMNGGAISASGGPRTLANNVAVAGNFSIDGTHDLTFTGTINLGGGTRTITVNNSGITTFAGSVTQPYYSGLTKAGAGTLVLSGDNSYAAPTTINAGTLVLAHDNALGQTAVWNQTIASGATLGLQGDINVNQGSFSLRGTGVDAGGAIRNLSGDNTLGGTLTFGGATSIISATGTLTLSGPAAVGSHTVSIGGAGNVIMSGGGYGSGSIAKNDTGTLTLSGTGANSFSNLSVNDGKVFLEKSDGTNVVGGGNISVGDGVGGAGSAVLQLGANNQLPDHATSFTINSDGTFDLNNFSEGVKTLSGTGRVTLGASGALTVGVGSGSSTFDGTISGGGTVEKIGSGTFTLKGASSYTGGTTISAGTFQLGASNVLSNTGAVDIAGGTLNLGSYSDTVGAVTLSAGTIAGTGTLTASSLDVANATDVSITANLAGSTGLTKSGVGKLTLTGANTFTGAIAIEGGTVQITANNVLRAHLPANGGVGNAVNVSAGATLALSGGSNYTNTIGSLTGAGEVSIAYATVLKVGNAAANTFDGTLTGTGLFDKIGSGTFTFSSEANTSAFDFKGIVQLTSGTMEFLGGTDLDAMFIGELKTFAGTTLFLDESFLNVGTLNITGDTILDFGSGGASILNANNIYIASGAVLTIRNWSSEVDFLFANVAFRQVGGGGTLAGFNTTGSVPQNQVHFEGEAGAEDGSQTVWVNYDYQGYTNWEIRPIPEPSTYGAMLLGGCFALLAWRRYAIRRRRAP